MAPAADAAIAAVPAPKIGFTGVHLNTSQKWEAQISHNTQRVYLGACATPAEAAHLRDM